MPTDWGNYRDYHSAAAYPGSNPAIHVRDRRLTLASSLIPGLFASKRCLDIGCNAGSVSVQLAFDFDAGSVTGVDIDHSLIAQAKKLLALRSSRVLPASKDVGKLVNYFPMSALVQHGFRFEPADLARPPSIPPAVSDSPRVSFLSADWPVSQHPAVRAAGSYDVILALSVVKWIHLQHGDQGLLGFFHKCSDSLVVGGHFVLELQLWSSYEKAVRPDKSPHFQQSFARLKYRPESSFDNLLKEQGLSLCATSDSLSRPIRIYCKG